MSLRVLVVDDDRDTANSQTMLLRLHGHEVHVAYDGRAALQSVQDRPPHVVFLDWAMPGFDGGELARRLREQHGMAHALVVCISGYSREEDRRRSREAGCNYHLTKPVAVDDLLALLAAVPCQV